MIYQNKKIRFYIILIYLIFDLEVFAQNNCKCSSVSNEETNAIEMLIDKKEFKTLKDKISKLPETTEYSKQSKKLVYLQLFIEQKKFEKADSLVHLWNNQHYRNLCPEILTKFNYCLGNIYISKEVPDSALYYFLKAKDYSISANNKVFQAKSCGRIAFVFNTLLKEPFKALQYSNQALLIIKEVDRSDLKLHFLCNKMSQYNRIYDINENKLYLDSMYAGTIDALKLARELKIPNRIGQTCSILAGVWFLRGNYSKALQYCDTGLASIERDFDVKNLHALITKKSDIYFEWKNYRMSKIYADSTLLIAQNEENTLQIISAQERLYYIEKALGNFPKALEHLEVFKALNDSLLSLEKSEVTNELEEKYNKVNNEKKIRELSHLQELSALRTKVIIAVSLLLILILVVIFQQRNATAKRKILEAEQRLNRLRMNPHFFFNSLAALQKFSLIGNSNELAIYIAKLSKIMRQTLESSFTEFVTIESEVEFLTNYLQVQKLMNENKFDFDINAEEIDDVTSQKIPTMLLQPFVENSIEHAFDGLQKMGMIEIVFEQQKEFVKIQIKDNGLSSLSKKSEKDHVSRALQIIDDRIFLLNKLYQSNARYDISFEKEGTVVEIFLPPLFHS